VTEHEYGARPPGPAEGLEILESCAAFFYTVANAFVLPMLVGMRGNPEMGKPDTWGLHMIGYLIARPKEKPEAERSSAEGDLQDVKEKLFSTWFGDKEEE
jgi:hypothetical protein